MTPSALRMLSAALLFAAGSALAVTAGTAAPDFTVTDSNGKPVRLADYRGRFVVLEWTNPECPFVQAQYGAATMQALQKEAAGRNVAWLAVNSTNAASGEYKTGAQMNAWMQQKQAAPAAVLVDGTSATGRAYDAKTTPHMFVIDPRGAIVYAGAIDDKRSARESDRRTAHNYVRAALDEALAGRPVTVASTQPYGCSVKY